MKVFEMAKAVGEDNKSILAFLASKNMPAKSHLSVLSDEQADIILKQFGNQAESTKIKEQMSNPVSTKRFRDTDMIPCRSVRGNRVIYASSRTGLVYDWPEFSAVVPVAYADLLNMYGSQSDYLYTPFILIEDEDLYLQWQSRLGPIYADWLDLSNPDSVFQQNDFMFEQFITNASKSMRELIVTTAVHLIKHGGDVTVRKLQIIDDVCGTALRELYQ